MSVLIFIDTLEGHVKKASFEAMTYGAKVAEQLGTTAEGIVLGTAKEDLAALDHLDAQVYTKAIADVAGKTGAKVIVFSNNVDGKAIAPRLSARLKAGLVSGAVALPDTSKGFVVKKNVFSGKAFANISLNTDIKIIALNPNAYQTIEGEGTAEVIATDIAVDEPKVKVTAVNKVSGEVPLTEAEIVVSAGRG